MREEQTLAEIEDFIDRLQPAHLPRRADQRPAGRYLVVPRWVVPGIQGPVRSGSNEDLSGR